MRPARGLLEGEQGGSIMEQYVELRLQKDSFAGGYSAGLTMCDGQSTRELKKVSEDERQVVYEDDRKHKVTLHREAEGDVVFLQTTFTNESNEPAVLEMLSSFASV